MQTIACDNYFRITNLPRRVKIAGRTITAPGSKATRTAAGLGLMFAGVLGFLPVLGFWMIPLGLGILSIDWASARRVRRQLEVKSERLRRRFFKKKEIES